MAAGGECRGGRGQKKRAEGPEGLLNIEVSGFSSWSRGSRGRRESGASSAARSLPSTRAGGQDDVS